MEGEQTRAQEWRRSWALPLVALIGMAGSGITTYSTGVFMGELTEEFGWTKTEFTSSMSIQLLLLLVLIPMVGRAIDRFGPRRVALAGIAPTVLATAALGLANGTMWQWWMLAALQTFGAVTLIPVVWITAVVSRFHTSRGLALAVSLAGIGFGTAVWPILAAYYVDLLGWRLAYGATALTWGVVITPLTIAFFYGAEDQKPRAERRHAAAPVAQHLRSRTFLALAGSGGLFVITCHGMTLHLVPILRDSGLDLATAASMAGVAGVASIIGRIATGVVLDIMPARRLGIVIFLFPMGVSAMLAWGGASIPMAFAAAALLGLSMGAEGDILNYIASRRFDHAIFGSIAAGLQTVMAVTSVLGVMIAAALTDLSGSYRLFLLSAIPATLLGSVLLSLLPKDVPDAVAH